MMGGGTIFCCPKGPTGKQDVTLGRLAVRGFRKEGPGSETRLHSAGLLGSGMALATRRRGHLGGARPIPGVPAATMLLIPGMQWRRPQWLMGLLSVKVLTLGALRPLPGPVHGAECAHTTPGPAFLLLPPGSSSHKPPKAGIVLRPIFF